MRLRGALVGALLAQGAPLGLLLLRTVWPDVDVTYLYLTVSTTIVFSLSGAWAGRAIDRLTQSAFKDPLTGLWNRRWLDGRLAEEVARARRYGKPISLLMIDVDRFKEINDREGHDGGDRALQALGELLEKSTREVDVVARYGGDEFVVLMPETPPSAAWKVASRVLAAARGGARFSVSIGVAGVEDSTAIQGSELVERADAALYRAKREGRDRAWMSTSPSSPSALPSAPAS